ncbi:MAG: glycerophosphodiester phosphodiesterase [Clostridiales bacterium]|nr:glycerophosphodiester phosphodiesterase [Clostridiales bacterium]
MEIKTSWVLNRPISHRGLHNFEFPENSLPAFENSVKHGFAIELDVRILDDRTIVVFHDDKLSRMSDRDGYVANLKASDLGEIKLLKTDYGIPTFERVLETVNGKVPLLIEIKKSEQSFALEEILTDMLKSYNGEYAVQSFDPFSMQYFYKNAPQILRGQLSSYFHHPEIDVPRRERNRLKKLKYLDVSHPNFIAYKVSNLPNKYVKNAGLPVIAWTVKNEIAAKKAQDICDNYIFEGFIPKEESKTDPSIANDD